jgi:hypothetical protein
VGVLLDQPVKFKAKVSQGLPNSIMKVASNSGSLLIRADRA